MPSLPADVLLDLGRVFAGLRVRWYVFGAQAAAIHGAPRLTIDVDVTVALDEMPIRALVHALGAAGFAPRTDDDELIEQTRVLPVIHSSSGIPVDIVLAGPGIEELFLERAQRRLIRGVDVPVACPEDIVAMKVLAGRAKDLDDVAAILRATRAGFRLELARETLSILEQALDRRDLLPLLDYAVAEVGGLGSGRAVREPHVTRRPPLPQSSSKKTGKKAKKTRKNSKRN